MLVTNNRMGSGSNKDLQTGSIFKLSTETPCSIKQCQVWSKMHQMPAYWSELTKLNIVLPFVLREKLKVALLAAKRSHHLSDAPMPLISLQYYQQWGVGPALAEETARDMITCYLLLAGPAIFMLSALNTVITSQTICKAHNSNRLLCGLVCYVTVTSCKHNVEDWLI